MFPDYCSKRSCQEAYKYFFEISFTLRVKVGVAKGIEIARPTFFKKSASLDDCTNKSGDDVP